MSKVTLTKLFLLWFGISVVTWIVSWKSGQLLDLMGQAVDLSGAVTPDVSRDEMVIGFIIMKPTILDFISWYFGCFCFFN